MHLDHETLMWFEADDRKWNLRRVIDLRRETGPITVSAKFCDRNVFARAQRQFHFRATC
jgi:hypothetical protein